MKRLSARNSFKRTPGFAIYYYVQRIMAAFLGLVVCVFAGATASAAHTRVSLLLPATAAKPGETVLAGVRLQMDEGWHTYWKNPSTTEPKFGVATKIAWQLPPGVKAGEIQWPLPEKHKDENGVTYIYHHDVVLLVPLQLASDLKPGPIELKATVRWLECDVGSQCIPGRTDVTASLEIADAPKPSADVALIESWQKKLPASSEGLNAKVSWEKDAAGDDRPLVIEWTTSGKIDAADFYPYSGENSQVQSESEFQADAAGKNRLRAQVKKSEGDWPKEIGGVLVIKTGDNQQAFEVKLPVTADSGASVSPTTQPSTAASTTQSPTESQSLGLMLLYAFLGGLILNVMPCVLPVIALKILGFVSQAKESPGKVRKYGLLYALGVLVSFLVLAGLVIGIKAAGRQAGWGIQFSNPYFIVGITALVTLVALNLFGVFEVTMSSRVMGAASGLAGQSGAAGAFFNGVLATVLATPCTAPFLGVALGFAFAQPSALVLLMFLTVGLGLAAPYVILSWKPTWLKFLPKPGAWMEKFKIAMGFPMLATAIWLASLTTAFYGDRTWWLGIFLVLLATAAWVFGEFFQRGSRRGVALTVVLLLIALGFVWPLEAGLRWRTPITETSNSARLEHAPEGFPWQRWSVEAVKQARDAGRVVIVDFTASWCQTCNINVKPAFEAASVIEKLKQLNAVALVADYTRFPDDMTEELARFNRRGVPLVLVYPSDATKPPIVLAEPLPYPIPYSPVILDALKKAS